MAVPRVAKAQPWAEISQRFQRESSRVGRGVGRSNAHVSARRLPPGGTDVRPRANRKSAIANRQSRAPPFLTATHSTLTQLSTLALPAYFCGASLKIRDLVMIDLALSGSSTSRKASVISLRSFSERRARSAANARPTLSPSAIVAVAIQTK